MSGPDCVPSGVCIACAVDKPAMMSRCEETFVCSTCRRKHLCCTSMPGWPDAERHDECATCWENRVLPAGWDAHLSKVKEGVRLRLAYQRKAKAGTVRAALTELLTENPGGIVTVAMVCERMGRVVRRNTVSQQAGKLGRSMCVGIPGASGGYRSRVAS